MASSLVLAAFNPQPKAAIAKTTIAMGRTTNKIRAILRCVNLAARAQKE
jgi:hypothetical protein